MHIATNSTNPRFRCYALVATVLLSLFALFAAGAQAQGKRVGIVIGNAKYANETVLANPHNDARLIARTLKTELSFDEVIEKQDLSRSQLYDIVGEISRRARGADAVVVYYSGHGMRGPGGNYLIPVDARISEEEHVRRDALPAAEIAEALQASNARVALLVLDACRDSPYSRRTRSASKGLARMNVSGGNLLVAYATSEGNTADDGAGSNSPYAKALADALKQSKPVLAQLDDVRRIVRQSTQNKQNPTREGDLEVNVYLINPTITINNNASPTPSAAPAVRTDPDEEAWLAVKSSNTAVAYDAYLAEFPHGRYAGAARIAKASLASVPSPALQSQQPTTSPSRPSVQADPAPLPQPTQQHARGLPQVSLSAPDIAENGAVVPIGAAFSPPLTAGDVVEMLVGDQTAAVVRVAQGALTEFQIRLRFPRSDTARLRLNGRELSASKRIAVTLPGLPAGTASFAGEPIRVRAVSGEARILAAAKAVNDGNLLVEADGLNVRIELSALVSENPYFGFKSPLFLSGKRLRVTLSSAGSTRVEESSFQ